MTCLSDCGSNQLIVISALISIMASDDLSTDDLNVLGNFIVSIGSLLLTKAAQLAVEDSQKNIKQQIQCLEEQLNCLKNSMRK